MRYRALDTLLAALTDPPPKKDPVVKRKPTNLPLTQMEPFADSLQVALGVRPSRTRYLPAPFGDNPTTLESVKKGPNAYAMEEVPANYSLRGTYDTVTREIGVRAGANRGDFESTYAHELAHALQRQREFLPIEAYAIPYLRFPQEDADAREVMLGGERGAELLRAAWQRWSGRPVNTGTRDVDGAGNEPLDVSQIQRLAKALERSYNRRRDR